MTKKEITHLDILGNELQVGDYVAASYYRGLGICRVVKLTPKMVSLNLVGSKWNKSVYPNEMVKLKPEDVTMYILREKK